VIPDVLFLRRLTKEIYFYKTVVNHLHDTAKLLRTFGIRDICNLKYEKRLLDRGLAHLPFVLLVGFYRVSN